MDPKGLVLLAIGMGLAALGIQAIRERKVEWRPGLVSLGRTAVFVGVALIALGVAWDVTAVLLLRQWYADAAHPIPPG